MSIQTEIDRLNTAKNDLKTALTAKGVTVPSGTRLDGYSALLEQLPGADAYLDKATYDPQGFKRDVFGDIAYSYTALYRLDGWTEADEDAKSKGYAYRQTVMLVPERATSPAVTADSRFAPGMGFAPTGIPATDEILAQALQVINDGYTTSGDGTVTTLVVDKPAADIPVTWLIRKE